MACAERPHRILLVDDSADEREAIACFLELEGVEVVAASDGHGALSALAVEPRPCLILLDLDMAGMDGQEFRRRQLLSSDAAGIPVLVLSGHPEVRAITRTMQARAVWRKPVELDHLLRAVHEHCPGH